MVPELIARLERMAERRDVAFAGGTVRWHRFGAGPPLVLIHGGHGSWMHWARNIDALSARHTVWTVDLPGYGDSDRPVRPNLDSLVDGLVTTLDGCVGVGTEVAMAGFSFGGLVAAHAAARRSAEGRGGVARLVLLGSAGHGGVRRPHGEPMRWKDAAGAELAARMRHNLAVQMIHDEERIDDLALFIHTASCRRARFHSRPFSRGDSLSAQLDRRKGETLFLWGEHDVTGDPQALSHHLTEGHPRRHARIVANAGHWVQYEAADRVDRLLLDWLDGDADSPRLA
ncbi:alpha/beta fold hydrolase [Azospirillum sp. B2RO_4]|uniref:alpha/beta fold hydrolase n=1 Tax=Azospirillum sp. B2RO_4 TaxID=3027796 RepID=UPI003DAA2F7C